VNTKEVVNGHFAAYVVIALALGFGAIWFASRSRGTNDDLIVKWGGLSVHTAILYGYFISWNKRVWHVWGFWFAMASVLIVHLLVFILILLRVDQWGALWFLPMYPIELAMLSVACDWAVQRTGNAPRRHKP
jgi:hypothetical protein